VDDKPEVDLSQLVPEGMVFHHGIAVYSYMNGDDEMLYGWHVDGDPHVSETLGLMELIKFAIWQTRDDD
jgi:hypothetical protein